MTHLELQIAGATRTVDVERLIIAGWTGRDRDAVEHHIAELAAIGVPRPRTIPCFYRVGANLLTTAARIEVAGGDSSGEVEFVLVSRPDGLHVGVGSDHTDRKVETYDITVSKQMCPKPIGRELWAFADVEGHWDRLMLRSWMTRDGARELYQEGPVTKMLAPTDLIARYSGGRHGLGVGTAMFGGTLPVIGAIGGGERFDIELDDPVRGRALRHAYTACSLERAE